MRIFFLLLLLAGAAIGIGAPWYVNNFSGSELGAWPVYHRGGVFGSFRTELDAADAPLRVLVDLTTLAAPTFDQARAVLTLTVASGGRTVLAKVLSFHDSVGQQRSPQSGERIYRADAGTIDDIAPGTYTFTVGQGDVDDIDIAAVDVVLRSDAAKLDPRTQPAGFVLMAVGLVGLVIAHRRRRQAPPPNPNSQPPPPRWGRDGASR